ncbi:MAG: tRNA dihydrouridine synthase DusB [Treponema sp.]|nr:tRNA dihydrouridine synthase DusB [Treponema sp.]
MTEEPQLYHSVKIDSLELSGNLFLAPVAGYSDRSFRSVCYEHGADFAYTEMVSSEALVRASVKTATIMERAPNEKNLAVQIFGGEEKIMAEATKIVINTVNPQLIDINAGCPVPKIIKTGAGSALTREPERLGKIVKAVCSAVAETEKNIPVTVKIRSGWDQKHISFKEAAQAAIENGAKAITLHSRTRAQGYEGKADWSKLAELVQMFSNTNIPIFGSGDVFTPEDCKRMLEETSCSAVMFARGAMGNPFIFTQSKQLLQTGSYSEIPLSLRLKTGMKELNLLIEDIGEKAACREMRKRFCGYTKGISGAAEIRKQIVACSSVQDYENVVLSCYFL